MLAVLASICAAAPQRDIKGTGPALWVARSGAAQIYLFGTVHLFAGPGSWLTPAVRSAFGASQELWIEIDLQDRAAMQRAMLARAVDPSYDLATRLPPAERKALAELMRQCGVGKQYSPHLMAWAANMLLAGCGLRAQAGPSGGPPPATSMPDSYLMNLAHAAGVRVHGLETPEQQIASLADVPDVAQVALLRRTLHGEASPDATAVSVQHVDSVWMNGNVEELDREVDSASRQGNAAMYQSFYAARNQRFTDAIARLLAGRRVAFVAIGAGHLAGAGNVREQLRKRGISVIRLE
jgi:uncharacterized protein YbaP (TraB family)